MDVTAPVLLPNSMYPAEALAVGGVVEIYRVLHAGVGGGEGNAGTRRVNLPHEHHRVRVGLKLTDDIAPLSFWDIPTNGHALLSGLTKHLPGQFDGILHP